MALPNPPPNLESLLVHSEWLASLARRLVVDRATADDLVQDTWVAALRNPPRQAHSLRAWLARVARRLARMRDPLHGKADALAREDSPPTDDVVARIEQERLLARLVLELEEPYRRVVLQRFYGGLSAARIARIESVPDATVRTRVRRALALLRERLERENGSDPRGWPLASFLLARETWNLNAANNGVILMSTKSTITVSVASGALCALAVTEGILPHLGGKASPAVASIVAYRTSEAPGVTAVPTPAADANTALSALDSLGPPSARRSASHSRAPALSPEDLRAMLLSSGRIDQVRAIELLLEEGSDVANQILVDAFLSSKDPVLLALLEEAMLKSPLAFAPAVMEAFERGDDPSMLARLTGLLAGFVELRPELEHQVVGRLIVALDEADESPDRAGAATNALASLGVTAADEITAFLVDRSTGPKGAGSAAWLLAQLPGERSELVREKLAEGLQSLDGLDDSGLTEEERDAVLQKTGSIAWATSLRPDEEHDRLGEILLANLLRTHDKAQVGTLAWSLGNLRGLTDGSRIDMTREILDALHSQADASIRQQYAGLLKKLVMEKPVGPHSSEILRLVQAARSLESKDGELSPLLDSVLADLRVHEQSAFR